MNRSKKKSFDWYGMRQRFSIRKYHIGAASVLLGTTLVLGAGTIVSAETGVNGDGASNGQIVPVNNDGISDGTQPQGDNQGNNSSGVQTGNTTNSTANVQPAGDTGSASGQPVGTLRSADTGTQGDGSTNQPVDESVIKFPTQDNQTPPAGYQSVLFHPSYVKLDFEGKPGEIEITRNGKPIQVVAFWVKTGTTWGTLKKDPQFRIPKYTVDDGDFILGYDRSVGQVLRPTDFDSLDDTPIVDTWEFSPTVDYIVGDVSDGKTFEAYMNSGSYAPYQILQFHGITLNANGGTVDGKAKKAFYVAYKHVQWGDELVTKKIVVPSRDGYTFVRWQTDKGGGIPTSGQIETTEFSAVWLKHPEEKVAVFDRTNLTTSEKEQVKQKIYDANPDLSTGVPQVIKAIEISATGEATVTFDDGTAVKVPSATLTNEDKATARSNAKAEIEKDAMEKSAAINASNLTEEEKREKLDEVNNAKAAADSAIDQASTSDELN
ncbi:YSIRK-type signal peptide-containing protein, partial [Streptococcus suis]